MRTAATIMAAAWLAQAALAQEPPRPSTAQEIAQRSYVVLDAIGKETRNSQDNAMRRCRASMEQALSAAKLGAGDMAANYWDVAARGCRTDAVQACRVHKAVAPSDCASMQPR